MVITHNITAQNAQRQFGLVTTDSRKSTEKLSSGYKINRAADDAAGLTISEKMRSQIRGLTQASSNCQDGISFAQTADGALNEVHDMLHRLKELAVQSANGTNTTEDRKAIQAEAAALTTEIDRVQQSTQFNTLEIFPSEGRDPGELLETSDLAAKTITSSGIEITWKFVDSSGTKVTSVDSTQGTGSKSANGNTDLAKLAQKAASDAVDKLASAYPNLFTRAATEGVTLGLELGNIDGKNNTLAYVQAGISGGGSSTGMSYTLKVDTSDFKKSGPYTDAEVAKLTSTIAHEMTHAMMDDTLTNGMFGGFPDWFVEGTAQTSSGDNGWISNRIGPTSSAADIKGVMSNLGSTSLGKYGSGYLAAMDLGYEVAMHEGLGTPAMDATTIKAGLDKLFTTIAGGKSLSDAIKDLTQYTGLSDFESSFKSGAKGTLQNIKDLLKARGTTGTGSVLAASGLSQSQVDAFKNPAQGSSNYYKIDPDYTKVGNALGGAFSFPDPQPAGSGDDLIIQAGAQNREEQQIEIRRYNISSQALFGVSGVDLSEQDTAKESLEKIDKAASKVSAVRSYYGALQNRFEHTIKNLDNIVENTTAAESQIRDTDMAAEMVKFTKNNILMQAGQSMMAQANQSTQGVLSLLQ